MVLVFAIENGLLIATDSVAGRFRIAPEPPAKRTITQEAIDDAARDAADADRRAALDAAESDKP